MTDPELYDCLIEKREILRKIISNTQTQLRFIPKQKIQGLWRVIHEREKLIEQLATVSAQLDNETTWKSKKGFEKLIQDIAETHNDALELSQLALTQGKVECNKLKGKLQRIRTMRSVKNRYTDAGAQVYKICRINLKG